MRCKTIAFLLIVSFLIYGCSVPQSKYDETTQEYEQQVSELKELVQKQIKEIKELQLLVKKLRHELSHYQTKTPCTIVIAVS